MATIKDLLQMKAKYQKMIEDEGGAILGGAFKTFFDACPNVKAVRWEQYTPYFNDGEECVFSVNEPTFQFAEKPGPAFTTYDSDEDGDTFYEESWQAKAADYKKAGVTKKAIDTLSEVFEKDVMKAVFGDHVRVIATREGFEVDEYSHD
jgi:hypothetical protein